MFVVVKVFVDPLTEPFKTTFSVIVVVKSAMLFFIYLF